MTPADPYPWHVRALAAVLWPLAAAIILIAQWWEDRR